MGFMYGGYDGRIGDCISGHIISAGCPCFCPFMNMGSMVDSFCPVGGGGSFFFYGFMSFFVPIFYICPMEGKGLAGGHHAPVIHCPAGFEGKAAAGCYVRGVCRVYPVFINGPVIDVGGEVVIVSAVRCIQVVYMSMALYVGCAGCSFSTQSKPVCLSLPYGFFVVGFPCQNVFSGEVFIAIFQMVHADCHVPAAFQIGASVFYFFCFSRYFPILI